MRNHIKKFLGESNYDALLEFCRNKGLFFEEFCCKIFDGVNYTYEEEDIISYLGGEDTLYGSNKELIDAIHNEYLSHYDSSYGTWDNITSAINNIVLWGDKIYSKDVVQAACDFYKHKEDL